MSAGRDRRRGAGPGPAAATGGGPGRPRGLGRDGLVLVFFGAAIILRQLGVRGVFFELVWLAAVLLAAAWTWRLVERRAGAGGGAGRRARHRLFVVVGFGLFAALTLDRLAGAAFLACAALLFRLLLGVPGRDPRRATGYTLLTGLFATLAATAAADALWPRWESGVVFFLGMTATFTVVYLLPRARGGARWALWPAMAWAVLTLIVNDPSGGLARWMLPLGLIGAGIVLLGYSRGRR